MTGTDDTAKGKVFEALGFARGLRQGGDLTAAAAVIDAVLSQPQLQTPATADLAAYVGWLLLERAGICEARGELLAADGDALKALACFESARDRGGQAAASLALGDLSWQSGSPGPAVAWWNRTKALADNTGHTPLAARALGSLALAELACGRSGPAQELLAAAEERAEAGLDAVVAKADEALHGAAQAQTDVSRASLTLVRCLEAIRAAHWTEARLLLGTSAESARKLESPELYVLTLRLDAVVARRAGDPRSAVEALKLARQEADRAGLSRQAALLDSELVLALADNESWAEAFEIQQREPPPAVASQPAVHAARLEAFGVLSLHSGNPEAAEKALRGAEQVRIGIQDVAGSARSAALLAEALRARGQLEDAWAVADRAGQAARGAGRLDVATAAGLTQLHLLLLRHDPRAAALASEVAQVAEAAGSSSQRIIALDGQAAAALQAGDLETAVSASAAASALAGQQPLLRLQARAAARKAQLDLLGGDAHGALRGAKATAELAARAEDAEARLRALLVAGNALISLGRNDEGLLGLTHAQTEALAADKRTLAAEAAWELGNGYLRVGRNREARHAFSQAVSLAREVGARALAAKGLRGSAAARKAMGQPDGALAALQEAAGEGDAVQAAMSAVDRARILVETGRAQVALEALEGLERAGEGRLSFAEVGEVRLVRGQALLTLGRKQEAVEALRQAVQAQRRGDERSLGAALFLLGQVEGMLGQGSACGVHLAEALVIAARLGLPEQHTIRRVIERIQLQADGGKR